MTPQDRYDYLVRNRSPHPRELLHHNEITRKLYVLIPDMTTPANGKGRCITCMAGRGECNCAEAGRDAEWTDTTPANEWREEFDKLPVIDDRVLDTLNPEQRAMFFSQMKYIKSFIQKTLDTHSAHLVERIEREVGDLRAEHANTARHGDTPDNAYDRVENLLWLIKQELADQAIDIVKDKSDKQEV